MIKPTIINIKTTEAHQPRRAFSVVLNTFLTMILLFNNDSFRALYHDYQKGIDSACTFDESSNDDGSLIIA